MQDFNLIWETALKEMQNEFSMPFINLWFAQSELAVLSETRAVVLIPSDFKCKMINEKYLDIVSRYLEIVLGFEIDAVVLSKEKGYPDLTPYNMDFGTVQAEQKPEAHKETAHTESEEDDKEHSSENAFFTPEKRKKYTFDNFLVGSSNKFAHAAAIAVANEPANAYNPLFIYGASGLGKTHLLCAITNRIYENDPDAKVLYVSGEDFANELISSITKHSTEAFREKYRNCTVLLIDDIQFIAGKVQTQEEFFHTFNALYDEGKQIILTSDRPPKDINPLEDRIRNRFEWGLLADIQPPNLELRIAILKDKAKKMNIEIPDEVFVFLAENLKNNVRQLEGALKKIEAKCLLEGNTVSFELAKASVSDMISGSVPPSVTIEKIMAVVSQKYGVTVNEIKSKRKSSNIVIPRHICVYLIRRMTDMSLGRIGTLFDRDHTTIMNSIKNIESEILHDSAFESEINDLIQEISGLSTENKQ